LVWDVSGKETLSQAVLCGTRLQPYRYTRGMQNNTIKLQILDCSSKEAQQNLGKFWKNKNGKKKNNSKS
jgi:hypothetical protein